MPKNLAIGAALALTLLPLLTAAQEKFVCAISDDASLVPDAALVSIGNENDEIVRFEAGAIDARMSPRMSASMTGGVTVRRGNNLAGADSAVYDPNGQSLKLDGNVRYQGPSAEITSSSAEFAYDTGQIRFDGAEFLLGNNRSRGAAKQLHISQSGTLTLDDVSYTTCPPESNDWLLEASDINIDTNKGVGTAKNVKLRFQGIPILYAPYLSFPVGNARKSGILTPIVGSAGRSGTEVSVPYYWNIRENIDATVTPRWLSDRGVQLGGEMRYLSQRNSGELSFEVLENDSLLDTSRHLISLDHSTHYENGLRNIIEFREVSDSQYFEDLGGTLSLSSITHLDRKVQVDYFGENWTFFGLIQDFQTLDETIAPIDEPYQRVPQFRASVRYPKQWLGLSLGVDSELVNFDRDTGVTGWRLDLAPTIELPIERAGWFIKPAAVLEHTRYDLSNTQAGDADDPTRTLPIASFDAGLFLERTLNSERHLVQTIEPRVLYVHVPFREQNDLPVFDTIMPDLNLVQLYRKNRFLGVDRVGDTDQLSVGITSRILDIDTGEELVSATIGQSRYLSDQRVVLPGQLAETNNSSDYIAEVSFLLYDHLNFDVGHQWGDSGRGTTQSEARLQYRPQNNKILNLAYRFRSDSLEQGDVSVSWPLAKNWNFVGRYNYSFRDESSLEQFFGLEYESCCWGLRLVSRRYLSTRDGTRDSSFALQLVLKGMTSLGTAADKLLERGILGYSPNIN